MVVNDEMEWVWDELSAASFKVMCRKDCGVGLRRTTKYIIQNVNQPGPPQYKGGVSDTRPPSSVRILS
jgi:hypothetical protein